MNFFTIRKLSLIFSGLLVVLFSNAGFAVEGKFAAIKDKHLGILLPIDATKLPRIHLHFNAPKDFVFDPAYLEASMEGRSSIVEFIPKNEKFNAWSRIITVNILKGSRISAHAATTKLLLPLMAHQSKNSKVLLSETVSKKRYQMSKIVILYTPKGKQKPELLYAEYYSGPIDTVGLQYAIKINHTPSDAEAIHEAKILKNFIHDHMKIIQK